MKKGKTVRVKVRTIHSTYTGDLFVPEMRNRLSDAINEPDPIFINLTLVEVEGNSVKVEHIALNKYLIEYIQAV